MTERLCKLECKQRPSVDRVIKGECEWEEDEWWQVIILQEVRNIDA